MVDVNAFFATLFLMRDVSVLVPYSIRFHPRFESGAHHLLCVQRPVNEGKKILLVCKIVWVVCRMME